MSMRLKRHLPPVALAGCLLALSQAACTPNNIPYTGPGWYLEKPRQTSLWGPHVFKGPMSYDECEAERTKLPERTAEEMLCIRETVPIPKYGPY
jgi:hypothetical protein